MFILFVFELQIVSEIVNVHLEIVHNQRRSRESRLMSLGSRALWVSQRSATDFPLCVHRQAVRSLSRYYDELRKAFYGTHRILCSRIYI